MFLLLGFLDKRHPVMGPLLLAGFAVYFLVGLWALRSGSKSGILLSQLEISVVKRGVRDRTFDPKNIASVSWRAIDGRVLLFNRAGERIGILPTGSAIKARRVALDIERLITAASPARA